MCPFQGHQAVRDVKILCHMEGGQWQVMHFIHESEGIEVKKMLP